MINYILTTTVCWGIFYLFYKLFLSRETFFKLNRIALLGGLAMGMLIPLLGNLLGTQQFIVSLPTATIQKTSNWISQTTQQQSSMHFSWTTILIGIYLIGVVYFATILCSELLKIYRLYRSAIITKYPNYNLVQTSQLHSPFSFGNAIFISQQNNFQATDLERIIAHEQAHVEQGHTFDIVIVEILKIIFWFNPLLAWYQRELKDIHEYLADGAVLAHTPIQQYGKLLIEQSVPGLEIAFANHFIYSQLKKRIHMMTKKRSNAYAYFKYLMVLPFVALLAWNIAAQAPKSEEKALTEVEQMPTFPGCTEGDEATRKACSTQNLMQFIGKNLKYPKAAKDNKTEGMAVISFVVDVDGSIIDAKIIKDVKDGCGAEALRVVNAMNSMSQKWNPGQKDGKAVKVEMKLPFKFKLS